VGAGVHDTVFVGNSVNDVRMGKAAYIPTVIFYPKENRKFIKRCDLEKEKPSEIIEDFGRLVRMVG
jgi:phosphoglycolate phosphatase-like HAD superfamily hydrolase